MASNTEFTCDHCENPIISGGTNTEKTGFCLDTQDLGSVKWTTNLYIKRNGPHICEHCVNSLFKAVNE